MADKKNKKPAVDAPIVDSTKEAETKAAVKVLNPGNNKGLSQGEKVAYLREVRARVEEMKEEENPPVELIAGYNAIRDTTIIDIAVGEIASGTSAMGFIFSGNEAAYKALQLAAAGMGVTLKPFKSLPAPSKSQLESVGLVNVDGTKLLQIENKDVSKEAKAKKKAEIELNKEASKADKAYMNDHTKIETDEQLKEALGFQLVNGKIASPIDRLITTAQFYRAYLEARAEKSDNAEAELAKIHENTLADFLQDITTMVPPTFAIEGFGKHLSKLAESTKSIIPAYNLFKKASTDRKTGKCKFSDEEIATLVRIIMVWNTTAQIASISKDLKVLNKDPKLNAKAIEECGTKISHLQDNLALVNDPDFNIADTFIAAYKNEEDENHTLAVTLYNSITGTYYADANITELELDTLLLNVQQRIGIILNLFNSPVGKRDEYSEANLISFDEKPAEEETKEDKVEEESKN